MQVQIELKGFLIRYAGPDSTGGRITVDLPQGGAVRDVLEAIRIPETSAGLILLNGQRSRFDTSLANGDVIIVFPLVAGG